MAENVARNDNEKLGTAFRRAAVVKRSPFFGIPMSRPEKAVLVQGGVLDGRSGWPIVREEPRAR